MYLDKYHMVGRKHNTLIMHPKALNTIRMNVTTPYEFTLAVINK